MDKLAEQLKSDAERIEVTLSDELDRRIDASLHAISPQVAPVDSTVPARTKFWWASSLTGATAAVLIIALVDFSGEPGNETVRGGSVSPVVERADIPVVEWKTQSAMLTSPLRKELEDLQADVEKAEQIVRREIGL